MANDTAQNKATNEDRFEVIQSGIEELKALIMRQEARLETAERRVSALSAQSSIDVMGVKAEEPHTKQNMTSLTPHGWDTTERQKAIKEASESKVVVNNAPPDMESIATAVALALRQADKKVA